MSCGGLRTLDVIVPLEGAIGVPVVSSTPHGLWHCARMLGVKNRIDGFGMVMATALQRSRVAAPRSRTRDNLATRRNENGCDLSPSLLLVARRASRAFRDAAALASARQRAATWSPSATPSIRGGARWMATSRTSGTRRVGRSSAAAPSGSWTATSADRRRSGCRAATRSCSSTFLA